MSRGKRYDHDSGLNYQKVFAVVIAIIVIIMFVAIIGKVLKPTKTTSKNSEYFAVYTQDKWGVINQEGEFVITPSYQEMIIVPNSKKDMFLCMYDVDEQTGTYKTKALNNKNEEILTMYDQIEAIENIDKNLNLWYEENVLKVKKNEKYGLIDFAGREILNCEYDKITAMPGIENSIIIEKDGKVGLCNNTGTILIEPKFKEIKNLGENYKEGYITVDENNKYGVVNTTKKQVLENKYEYIKQLYSTEIFVIKEDNKEQLINTQGEKVLESGFDEIKQILKDAVIFTKDSKYGVMNISSKTVIEPKYEYLKQVKDDIFIAKENGKYGIIDIQGNNKLPFKYESITYNEKADLFIADDVNYNSAIINSNYNVMITGILVDLNTEKQYIEMRVNNEYKYYNLKCEETTNIEVLKDNTLFLSSKNGKYGYINQKGEVIVDYIYDDATEQNKYGYSAVKSNGVWGSIDSEGNIVISPKYDLEDNLVIDFIGKWHLGQDLNMNYYCEK